MFTDVKTSNDFPMEVMSFASHRAGKVKEILCTVRSEDIIVMLDAKERYLNFITSNL